MKNKFLISVLYNSSIIFTVLCLISTLFFALLFWGFSPSDLPSLGTNCALLIFSYIVSFFISLLLYKLKKPYISPKINFLYFGTTLFTYLFISLHFLAVIVTSIWGGIMIASIFALAILTTIVKYLPKFPYFLKVIFSFFIYAVPYFGISVFVGEFGKGNKMMILISVYLLVFAIAVTVVSIIRNFLLKQQNNQEKYSKMFK